MNLSSLLRPNLKNLTPYATARSEFSGDASLFLDANENAFGSPVNLEGIKNLNRYPDPFQIKLRSAFSKLRKIPRDQIFLGVGSDEVIDLLLRMVCIPGQDEIIIFPPSYGIYEVAAKINDVKVKKLFLNSETFTIAAEKILKAVTTKTKLIFFCSPNNPTGNLMNKEEMIEVCRKFQGLVVVDEAYIDFAEKGSSMLSERKNFPNLVILQTFSKAWGLAGIRLGLAFASPAVIDILFKIKSPYNINQLTSQVALQAIQKQTLVKKRIRTLQKERDQLILQLKSLKGIKKVFPSASNFILFKVLNAKKIYKALIKKGVIIRFRGNDSMLKNTLRVTVGTPEENKRFLPALSSLL